MLALVSSRARAPSQVNCCLPLTIAFQAHRRATSLNPSDVDDSSRLIQANSLRDGSGTAGRSLDRTPVLTHGQTAAAAAVNAPQATCPTRQRGVL
jgi:hypothetical protein